jgi:hypothetical protein
LNQAVLDGFEAEEPDVITERAQVDSRIVGIDLIADHKATRHGLKLRASVAPIRVTEMRVRIRDRNRDPVKTNGVRGCVPFSVVAVPGGDLSAKLS